jgi:hypothetical protein
MRFTVKNEEYKSYTLLYLQEYSYFNLRTVKRIFFVCYVTRAQN